MNIIDMSKAIIICAIAVVLIIMSALVDKYTRLQ